MNAIMFQEESYRIMGACFEVYKEKGCGFLEGVYQECLQLEFGLQSIPNAAQQEHPLTYKGRPLKQTFRSDFVCYGNIIVELKAVKGIADEHRAQVLNYLNATGFRLGLLVNFGGHPQVEWERIVL